MTFTRIGIIVVITAAAFYFGLNYFFPRNHADQKPGSAVTADQVFSSNSASAPAAAADGSVPTDAAPAPPDQAQSASGTSSGAAAEAASGSGGSSSGSVEVAQAVPVDSGDSNTAPAPAAADAGSASTNAEAASSSSSSGAAETAQSAPDNSSSSSSGGAEVAQSAAASSSSSSSGAAEVEQSSPAGSGESSAATASATDSATAAAPASAEPAAAPAPKKHRVHPAADAGVKSAAVGGKGHPDEDEITAWWPAVEKQSASQLNLTYAGEAKGQKAGEPKGKKAVVLLFSDNVDAAAMGSQIELLNYHGKPAPGQWAVSPDNPRMLIFNIKQPGRYLVILPANLAGTSGKTLGVPLHGPVYVH